MLDRQQKKDLERAILQGLCSRCNSLKVKYYEVEKNQKFGFKCDRCGYKAKYIARDLECLSLNYLVNHSNYL